MIEVNLPHDLWPEVFGNIWTILSTLKSRFELFTLNVDAQKFVKFNEAIPKKVQARELG